MFKEKITICTLSIHMHGVVLRVEYLFLFDRMDGTTELMGFPECAIYQTLRKKVGYVTYIIPCSKCACME